MEGADAIAVTSPFVTSESVEIFGIVWTDQCENFSALGTIGEQSHLGPRGMTYSLS